MKRVAQAASIRRAVRKARTEGAAIGFVPTMGFLHQGHLALVERARRECDVVVVSIFVNPLQFGPSEDYASYPRDPARDRALLRAAGVDLLFEPVVGEFYPKDFSTFIEVSGLDARLCGPRRPGHFRGVATVVAKLLHAVEPDRTYLGLKDIQQVRVLERMMRDLDFPGRVVRCPTVREPDGLAMSSRNVYLSPEERAWAPLLHRALAAAANAIEDGAIRDPRAAVAKVERLLADGPGQLEYVEILAEENLEPVDPLEGELVIALAYRLGRARLIDNVLVTVPVAGGSRARTTPASQKPPRRKAVVSRTTPAGVASEGRVTPAPGVATKGRVTGAAGVASEGRVTPAPSVARKKRVTPAPGVATKGRVTVAAGAATKKRATPAPGVAQPLRDRVRRAHLNAGTVGRRRTSSRETELGLPSTGRGSEREKIWIRKPKPSKQDGSRLHRTVDTAGVAGKGRVTPAPGVASKKRITPAPGVATNERVTPAAPGAATRALTTRAPGVAGTASHSTAPRTARRTTAQWPNTASQKRGKR